MALWTAISHAIAAATAAPFDAKQRTPLSGGCINEAWRLSDGRTDYFVKLNHAATLDMFAAEAEGLAELARPGAILVPRPICHGRAEGRSFLVLTYLPMHGRAAPECFGRALAHLHAVPQRRFGWHRDNTIGATPQPNAWDDDWLKFWRERRLGFQLDLAARRGAPKRLIDLGRRLQSDFAPLFAGRVVQPSVLHGDLWSGNWGFLADGSPVIFDPAVYFGDHEADLAMMELFGSPGATFLAAYREVLPIDAGYPVRRGFYNLYHVLNHYNLFGGGYGAQAERMAQQLLAELR